MTDRFDRNERFFGKDGQANIGASRVVIIGIGGLGTHVVQQLALLGVRRLTLIDSEELDRTNLNRYIGALYSDPIPGTRKVDIGERLAKSIDPNLEVVKIHDSFVNSEAFDAISDANYVFGCLDSEGARLILNEVCAVYDRPYFDLASDIQPGEPLTYGGRIYLARKSQGCLVCMDVIDIVEAQVDLAGPEAQRNRAALYGVNTELLHQSGPSVVSINGVVASLAVTEFMVDVTGLRPSKGLLTYYGHSGKVVVSTDEPAPDCYYCCAIRGRSDDSGIREYIAAGLGKFLR